MKIRTNIIAVTPWGSLNTERMILRSDTSEAYEVALYQAII